MSMRGAVSRPARRCVAPSAAQCRAQRGAVSRPAQRSVAPSAAQCRAQRSAEPLDHVATQLQLLVGGCLPQRFIAIPQPQGHHCATPPGLEEICSRPQPEVDAATVVGSAATANAEPNNGGEWDIEAYDKCMEQTIRSADACCINSGGWIAPDKPDGSPNCMAPPAAPAGSTLPGEQLNPNLPAPTRETLTPGPVPPPVEAAG